MNTPCRYGEFSYYLVDENKRLVFMECALCHRMAAFFTNSSGVTHCLACEKAPVIKSDAPPKAGVS